MDPLHVDTDAELPPYEQVRRQLAGRITDGTLTVGTRLPTVRSLAAELSLAVNTVARAYRELEEGGLVETRGRAGTFVSPAGSRSRELALEAAADYVRAVRGLGLDDEEALRVVRAALAT
ncbi:GntR family transcriptional regulator [Georgenia deserti]|uniref:GntR family transcriptional regulator n=1 Tax=Georgenia deserti TaxID=2093781 RepID=A0ABW4L6E3_9MICO